MTDGARSTPPRAGEAVGDLAAHLLARWPRCPLVQGAGRALSAAPDVRGEGAVIGLLDAGWDDIAALRGADVRVRSFAQRPGGAAALREHGVRSASMLAAQGPWWGIAPRAALRIATVCEDTGRASPTRAAEALAWLVDEGATVIAIPLGDRASNRRLSRAVARATASGVRVLAAAGNAHPERVMFPARRPDVLAIGALASATELRADCCRAPRLDLLAPGDALPGLGLDGQVVWGGGSSLACVVAAGLLALGAAP